MAMYRKPQTTNERRQNEDDTDTGGHVVKMRKRDLPTSNTASLNKPDNCWKRHRRTKYRPTKAAA